LLEGAPLELVKAAYKTLARLYHPDQGGSEDEMKRINVAYKNILASSKS